MDIIRIQKSGKILEESEQPFTMDDAVTKSTVKWRKTTCVRYK